MQTIVKGGGGIEDRMGLNGETDINSDLDAGGILMLRRMKRRRLRRGRKWPQTYLLASLTTTSVLGLTPMWRWSFTNPEVGFKSGCYSGLLAIFVSERSATAVHTIADTMTVFSSIKGPTMNNKLGSDWSLWSVLKQILHSFCNISWLFPRTLGPCLEVFFLQADENVC